MASHPDRRAASIRAPAGRPIGDRLQPEPLDCRRHRMRWRGIGTLVTGSLVWLGVACSGDDQGPSEPPLVIEKPATKHGDGQTGPVCAALGNPVRVLITREGEPVEGVNVAWTAAQGGSIGSAQESDELGIATAVWTLGPDEGSQVVSAEVAGATNSPLTYTATAE